MKQLINNITADILIIDYLPEEKYIQSLSSESDRFQKRTNHPKEEDKLIPQGDLTIPGVGRQTEQTPKSGVQ